VIKVEVPQDQANKLVVDGWLYNDSTAILELSTTAPYFQNGSTPRVTDAFVTLSNGSQTDTLYHISNGRYENKKIIGEVGKTYLLTIKTKDGKEYTSVNTLPRGIKFDSIYFKPFNPKDSQMFAFFSYQENLGPGDYYMSRLTINDTVYRAPNDLNFTDDTFIDGAFVVDVFAGFHEVKKGNRVRVEGLSLTKACFNYLYQIQQNTSNQGNLFSPPAAPIQGNISNGALGLFRTCSRDAVTRIVP
jgi:hypothetical protein